MSYNLLAISGSLREKSFNTALLRAFALHAPEGVTVEHADISQLALYNQDDEVTFPAAAHELKSKIRAADGIIIATPEYNRSIPGVLKNAIDWTSRPYGDSAWKGKPVYVIGASVGPISAALAQYHLKQIMLYLDAHVMGQPEFYVGGVGDKFEDDGTLIDEPTKEHVVSGIAAFIACIDRVRA